MDENLAMSEGRALQGWSDQSWAHQGGAYDEAEQPPDAAGGPWMPLEGVKQRIGIAVTEDYTWEHMDNSKTLEEWTREEEEAEQIKTNKDWNVICQRASSVWDRWWVRPSWQTGRRDEVLGP
jgi:hypothetical protein